MNVVESVQKSLYKMLSFDPSLRLIYQMSPQELQNYFRISPKYFDVFYYDLHHKSYKSIIAHYRKMNINVVTIVDEEYPVLLDNIYQPPFVLYCKGNLELLSATSVAVVGTRNPTNYGIQATTQIVKELVSRKYVIVSGLARGIDIVAHRQAIKNSGYTIAVLGSGFMYLYPKEHTQIADFIGKNHLLISEYPPYTKPQKHQFPERNRIISGISQGTVVVEAKEKSGSLITADLALQEGREVFAVPGSIFSPFSEGTNSLIQQGAKLIMNINDIVSELPENKHNYV